MIVEQLSPQGSEQISIGSFGEEVVETRSPKQLILHGPVLYVMDPFRVNNSVQTDKRVFLPIFLQHERFVDQLEYRVVIWTD